MQKDPESPTLFDTAVYIGRFQPVHSGHIALLARALASARQVIVIMGSAWQARSPKNPFTWTEREAMLRNALPESDRARLRLGQKAEIRANGYEDSFQAELAEMAPEVDSVRGTLEARLRTAKAPDWLIPGQTVDVNLILDEQKPRLVVPLTSVILRGDKAELAVIKDGTVHLQAVEISSPLQEGYLIRSGLQGGETLAKAPQGLTEGQKVRPREGFSRGRTEARGTRPGRHV